MKEQQIWQKKKEQRTPEQTNTLRLSIKDMGLEKSETNCQI